MERPRILIILFLLVLSCPDIAGSYRGDIYSAYVHNNMLDWKMVIDEMEMKETKDNGFLLDLVNFQYGYIAWCIGNKKEDEAKKYLQLAEKNLSLLSKVDQNVSKVNAYKSAFYGYKIGLNKMLAPFLGLNSINCAKTAIQLNRNEPLGYIQYANIQFYMPAVFGGSKKDALTYYLRAQQLMEEDEKGLFQDWNYLSLLVSIAQSYSYLDDLESSLSYLDKILTIEPEFSWVRDELYPEILIKMKK